MKTKGFARGDVDGFVGLFIDNLMQLMLIIILCRTACGFPAAFVAERILPGAAASIFIGNLFYAWQARRLERSTGRAGVTALPFGINTVCLLAFIYLVMGPVYDETGDTALAWKAGLAACFFSGIIEMFGAFFGGWIRKRTPRPALLAPLAGVALSFMVLGFSFQIFGAPLTALVPMVLILVVYGARLRLPFGLPVTLAALVVGLAAAWLLKLAGIHEVSFLNEPAQLGFYPPRVAGRELIGILFERHGWSFLSVAVPMGVFNVISSIQNLESAEAAGDAFATRPVMLVNGLTTLLAASLGSPFPTTIYIGHAGWKSIGAGANYSAWSGTVVALLCLCGGITVILKWVPLEITLGLLVWIGLVIVAQAFQETERRHSLAVVFGLLPGLAAWTLHTIEISLRSAGTNLYEVIDRFEGGLPIHGIVSLYQGFLLSGMIWAALMAYVIDRKFRKAAGWCLVAAFFSCTGLIHAYDLTPAGIQNHFGWVAAPSYAAVYAVSGLIFMILHATHVAEQ